jgi:hypothetical protein
MTIADHRDAADPGDCRGGGVNLIGSTKAIESR